MANFPVSLDTITNPTSGNTLDNPSHSLQHSDANDILEALERKVGIGTAVAGSASTGVPLVHTGSGTTSWTTLGTAGISSGTATSGQLLTANGSGGVNFSNGALTLISTTSFTTQSSQALPLNTFTSTFENYRIIWRHTQNTASGTLTIRMRAAGVNDTAANYGLGGLYSGVTSVVTRVNTSSATSWTIFTPTATNITTIVMDILGPQIANQTLAYITAQPTSTGDMLSVVGQHYNATSYDALDFITSGGTMTGQVSVYGYNK